MLVILYVQCNINIHKRRDRLISHIRLLWLPAPFGSLFLPLSISAVLRFLMSHPMNVRPCVGDFRAENASAQDDNNDNDTYQHTYSHPPAGDSFEYSQLQPVSSQGPEAFLKTDAHYSPVYGEEDAYDDGDEDDDEDFYGNPNAPSRPNNALFPQQHPQQLYTPAPMTASQTGPQQHYPQRTPSPPPLLDHSHLRPGENASLLSYERTLALYRANAKKTNLPRTQYEFAVFMIDAVKRLPIPTLKTANQIEIEKITEKRDDMIREATSLLKKLADRGHPDSQYFLPDCYSK